MIRLSTKLRFGWFEGCLIALTGYGLVSACSSTASHSVGNAPDAGGGRGGAGATAGGGNGGSGATLGRGGADGSGGNGGNGGSSGTGPAGSGGMGGTEGGDASAGTAGMAGTAGATGGSNGTGATDGAVGTGGRDGSAGTSGTGGTGGRGGASGAGGSGGGTVDAGPPNWCATQTRPAGVAVADYQCLDFENGLPLAGTWAPTLSGQGTRSITTARASSLPQSLLTSTGSATASATPQRATLEWQNVGATGVSSVSIAAHINPVNFVGVAPPWTGSIDLMCASFGSGDACFSYTRGADLSFANGYTGYFIEHTYTGGPAFRFQCQVTGSLTSNLWTRVELRLTRSPATIEVFIAGANAGQCNGSFLDDTAADVSFGMRAFSEAPGWTVYYDNVVAAVRR